MHIKISNEKLKYNSPEYLHTQECNEEDHKQNKALFMSSAIFDNLGYIR